MKRLSLIVIVLFITAIASAQDTLYIYKGGAIISKYAVAKVDSITFTPPAEPTSGTISDIDGNVYHWITIGSQKWMVENLRTTKYRSGESISCVTDNTTWSNASFGAYCYYNNSIGNNAQYGNLYNWYAVNDSRKIAPAGWHIPTNEEWNTMITYLVDNGYNADGSTTWNKVARSLAAKSNWATLANSGFSGLVYSIGYDLSKNNSTGFTALPGGYRNNTGNFEGLSFFGYWWSATENDSKNGKDWYLYYPDSSISNSYSSKSYGYSVRCVKD
jgi:Fibrobacter succinogenes major domain (Fib_succ_major).